MEKQQSDLRTRLVGYTGWFLLISGLIGALILIGLDSAYRRGEIDFNYGEFFAAGIAICWVIALLIGLPLKLVHLHLQDRKLKNRRKDS